MKSGSEREGFVNSTGDEKIVRLLRHRVIVPASAGPALRIIRKSVNWQQVVCRAVPRRMIDRSARRNRNHTGTDESRIR